MTIDRIKAVQSQSDANTRGNGHNLTRNGRKARTQPRQMNNTITPPRSSQRNTEQAHAAGTDTAAERGKPTALSLGAIQAPRPDTRGNHARTGTHTDRTYVLFQCFPG